MHTIRINGNLDALERLKDLPNKFHHQQMLITSGEQVRDCLNSGQLTEVHELYLDLKDVARKNESARALYLLSGIVGKLAEQRGEYLLAKKYFLEQLDYCSDPAVNCDEHRAQVYVDLARNELSLKRKGSARKFLSEALRCRVKFKSVAIEIERLHQEMPLSDPNRVR